MKADKKFRTSVENAEVTEEIEKAATLIAEAHEPLIFSSPSFFEASANISLLKGKIVAVPLESNAKGVSLMGLISEGRSYQEIINGGMKVLYVVGEVPLNQRPNADFLIVQNSHMTALAKQADVVLPSAAFFEASGTIIDYMGRMKHLHKISDTPGQSMSHRDIFISLAKAMGAEIRRPAEDEVRKTARVKLKITFSPWAEKEGFYISPEEFIEAISASVINGSRLLWLKETEHALTP
jgi:NADH dehydrogenase/NADH:ubiquinone oxidoreductase subunit G